MGITTARKRRMPTCVAVGVLGVGFSGGVIASPPVHAVVEQDGGAGPVRADVTRYVLEADSSLYVPLDGRSPELKAAFPKGLFPNVGSGLTFKGRVGNALEFYAITDRGANADGPGKLRNPSGVGSKLFPSPAFHPSYGLIRVSKASASLVSLRALRTADGRSPSGFPPPSLGKNAEEVPLGPDLRFDSERAGFDPLGLDAEAIVSDSARKSLWVADEYGPYLLRIEPASGRILEWLRPGDGPRDLPKLLASRRSNRGLENLALVASTGHLHGALQSPIDPLDEAGRSRQVVVPGGKSVDIKHAARFIRWIDYDPATGRSVLMAYPVDGSLYEKGRTGAAKLGDITSLGKGRFLAVEQGARARDGQTQNWLMLVEVPADVSDITAFDADLEASSITGQPVNAADFARIVPLRKTKLFDLNEAGWKAEKAEGLALVDPHTVAIINDNDFGIRTALFDARGKEIDGNVGDCTVDAATGELSDCAVTTARIVPATGPGTTVELWMIRFDRELTRP